MVPIHCYIGAQYEFTRSFRSNKRRNLWRRLCSKLFMTLFSIKNPFSGKCSTQSSRYWHSQQLLLINMGIQIHTTPVNTFYWTRTVPDHLYQLDLSNCKSLQMSIPPLPPLCYTIHEFQVKNNQGKFVLMSLRDLRSNNMTGTGDRRDWESTLLSLLFKC